MTVRNMLLSALGAGALCCVQAASADAAYNGVQVDGTCDVGSCGFTNPVPYDTNVTEPFSLNTTVNGDAFSVVGSAVAYNNGDGGSLPEGLVYTVTYLGGGPSNADTVSVNDYVAFQTAYGYGYFGSGAAGYVGAGLASGSSASFTGYGPTLEGPFTAPGSFDVNNTNTLYSSAGAFDFEISSVSQFAAGSAPGAYIVYGQTAPAITPVPEPGSLGIFGATLVGFLSLRRLQRG